MPTLDDDTLAQWLLKQGLISDVQLEEAKTEAASSGTNLVQTLLRAGYVSAHEIARAAEAAGPAAPAAAAPPAAAPPARPPGGGPPSTRSREGAERRKASLASYDIDPAAVKALPRALADEHHVLPISISSERLILAMADATDVMAIDAVRLRTGRLVEPLEVDPAELRKAIDTYYNAQARATAAVAQKAKDLSARAVDVAEESGSGRGVDLEMLTMLDQAPVVRVVETIVREAIRMNASDIHLEPRHDRLQVRYRIDGVLQTTTNLPKDMQQYILSRVKILADMDISDNRLPQSGRFEFVLDERPIDLRVSSLPTFWGEKCVMRLLDKSRIFVSLSQLGFQPDMQEGFERLLRLPQGLLLVTGPTGSGKTTTLYASLHTVNDDTKNITTVEDPVEYEVEGLNQTQVHPRIELTFAAALREILRQDPDVILVGETRDLETAQMTFRAAMTGHLVLSTLHTNDAPSAATRLVDMGIPPYIVGSSLTGVLAQRLVRRICPRCRAPHKPTPQELKALNLSEEQAAKMNFFWGRGCVHCRNTGYSGRVALYELLVMNAEVRRALSGGEDASVLRTIALKSGMKPMRYDGLAKIHQGVTTAQEVVLVTFAPGSME